MIIILLWTIIIIIIIISQCVGARRIISWAEQLLASRRVGSPVYTVLGTQTSVAVCRVTRTPAPLRRPVAFRLNIIILYFILYNTQICYRFVFYTTQAAGNSGRILSDSVVKNPAQRTYLLYNIIIIFVIFPAGR